MREHASETLLVVGATSGIAQVLCRQLAERGYGLVIAGRDPAALSRLAADVEVRSQREVRTVPFDALDSSQCAALLSRACEETDAGLGGVVVCHGTLPPEAEPVSSSVVERVFQVNLVSAAIILEQAADYFGRRGGGVIVGLSSVAGDRGRQSNYLYGASKAGLTAFLSGLRNRLSSRGVAVITVKPGFVDTPMIHGRRPPPSLLVASPERVAADIVRAIERRSDVVYVPWYWRGVMAVIKSLPEWLFKRLSL